MGSGENDPDDTPPLPPEVGEATATEPEVLSKDSEAAATAAEQTGAEAARAGEGGELTLVNTDDLDAAWAHYFRYESAYADQVDAIDTCLDVLADNGYFVLEGACGTGKTLAAVTAGVHAIRDRGHLSEERLDDPQETYPDYSRLLVVTSVKQQIRQFIEEMRGVNKSLPETVDPIPTVIMRGRQDMMPYAYVDCQPFDEHGVRDKMDDLREMTREVIKFGSSIPLDWPGDMNPPAFSKHDYNWDEASEVAEEHQDRYQYDPVRAEAVKRIVSDIDEYEGDSVGRLTVNGVRTPYPELVPHTNDIVDASELGTANQLPTNLQGHFDPFYAGYFAGDVGLPFGFEDARDHVFDQEVLFRQAASHGICPHEAMADLAGRAEVTIGNYYHLFDPQTRMLTDDKIGLLDEETIAVVDEAHEVEEKVRDLLSMSLDLYTLDRAINDVEIARKYAIGELEETPTPNLSRGQADSATKLAERALKTAGTYSVSVEDLRDVEQFLNVAKQKLTEYGAEAAGNAYENLTWEEGTDRYGADEEEKPLVDPEDPSDEDSFMADLMAETDLSEAVFHRVYPVMLGVTFVYDALEEEGIYEREPQGVEVGIFFKRWATEGRVEYHREVVLEDRHKESIPSGFPEWVIEWTPKFQLYNCLPRDELRAVFSELGGGVLMSATLQPADVFKEAVGIDAVPYPSADDEEEGGEGDEEGSGGPGTSMAEYDPDSTAEGPSMPSDEADLSTADTRPTAFREYPLRFPEENRLSLAVELPEYTSSNRKGLTRERAQMSSVRRQYADTLEELATMQGNLMVAMPNYGEAKWAHDYLRNQGISKRLHLDQSSSDRETSETLDSFFADGDAIIFTSLLGTITEGVDYEGGKLHGCIAVGVPYKPTHSPRNLAIKAAYDERISEGSGFETALTVPAVRKVRQAFGRVIRGADEVGVRILLDRRYTSDGWKGVKEYLSTQEQDEFQAIRPDGVKRTVSAFWDHVSERLEQMDDADELASEAETEGATDGTAAGSDTDSGPEESESSTASDESPGTPLTEYEPSIEESGEEVAEAQPDSAESESDEGGMTIETPSYSKIYFGKGANLSSWIPIETDVVENEIVPLVRKHRVDEADPDVETIKLNFGSDVSVNGWTDVKADVVRSEIEPLAKKARHR